MMSDQDNDRQDHGESDASAESERRKQHRRCKHCNGYAYIEMVGWMDRRESVRRDEDTFGE